MKKCTVAEFLNSLSIPSASNTWKILVKEGYNTLEKINAMSVEEIASAGQSRNKTVGRSRAEKIHAGLHSEEIQEMLEYAGEWIMSEEEDNEARINSISRALVLKMDLDGKKVVMTGAGPMGRAELKEALENAGATVQSSVSGNTDYLIMADPDSQTGKAKKARNLGVITIGYSQVF